MVLESGESTNRRLTRAEQKERTRRRLLEAAGRLFAARGYVATGLDEIAEEAGLTKGAVYSNFTSKADLALGVLDVLALEPKLDIFSRVEASEGFDDQHRHGGKLLVEAMDASALWFQVELQCILQAERDPELRRRLRARDAALRSSLATSISGRMERAGWTPDAGTDRIVGALIAVASGIALQRLKDPELVPDDLAGQLITAVYHSFATKTARTADDHPTGRRAPPTRGSHAR